MNEEILRALSNHGNRISALEVIEGMGGGAGGGPIVGTPGQIVKFTGVNAIGDSLVYEDAVNAGWEVPDDWYLGFTEAAGRLEFDSTPATDQIKVATADLNFVTAAHGIIHVDGVAAGMFLRADGTRYVPNTIQVADLPAHSLLSATHGDTAAQVVSVGSLVYGDATPDWNELVHPGATANHFQTTGAATLGWATNITMADGAYIGCDAVSPLVLFDNTNDELELTVTGGGIVLEGDATSPNVRGGFSGNTITATVVGATISGGGLAANVNTVTDNYGTIGGGALNQAGDGAGTVSDMPYATVGGGWSNLASGEYSVVAGGRDNTASGYRSAVLGGDQNVVSADWTTIGGGLSNAASAQNASVLGGSNNTASGAYSTICGGTVNTASGYGSMVPNGAFNVAAGDYSFAGGRRAIIAAAHDGTFLWADWTDANFNSLAASEFALRARGGFRHAYDDANYWTAQVSATGAVTFDATGAGATFAFSDDVGIGTVPTEMLHLLSATSVKPVILIENTNADALAHTIDFYKNSASPADDDNIGAIDFYGETSTGAIERYAYILSESLDVTNGDTGGSLRFQVVMDAVERNLLELRGYNGAVNEGEIFVNREGQDVDFTIEAVGVANALFVQGSDGALTVGGPSMTVPDGWILGIGPALERIVFDAAGDIAVMGANFFVGTLASAYDVAFYNPAGTAAHMLVAAHNDRSSHAASMSIVNDAPTLCEFTIYGTTAAGAVRFGLARAGNAFLASNAGAFAVGTIGATNLTLGTNNTARMTILSTGEVGIGALVPGSLTEWNFADEDLEFVDTHVAVSVATVEAVLEVITPTGGAGYIPIYSSYGT